MVVAPPPLPRLLKLLADPTRLRMLGLLEREELSVGELARSLGMAQSRVSNHLRLLREAGLLVERHAGASIYLQLSRPTSANGEALARRIWTALSAELDGLAEHAADLARLEGVLAERGQPGDFFDRLAGDWNKIAGEFDTGQARLRTALHLLPSAFVVADLGCGTGYMAGAFLGRASRLICVDRSTAMLHQARERLEPRRGRTTLEFRQGELDDLPLEDASLDGLVAGMVFHHLAELERPLAEMRRVLKPGGTAAVLELAPHKEAWMHAELGDRHLGLEPSDVLDAFERAGFEDIALDPIEDRYRPRRPESLGPGDPPSLPLFVVRGSAPHNQP